MKNILLIIINVLFVGIAQAKVTEPKLEKSELQSKLNIGRRSDSASNISIQNTSGAQTFTLTGIFIQQLFQADCTTSYFDNHGALYGTMWSNAITLTPSASTPLGGAYLYSMMMNYLFESAQNAGPAATTPGAGAGTWCIQLGLLQGGPAKYPTYSVSTNTSPSVNLSNVLTWTNSTTPAPIAITCNNSTQLCTANSATTQAFP